MIEKGTVEEGLDYFFRYCEGKLTEEEEEEEKLIMLKNKDRKISSNPYCAFGCYEDEEILSIDTH